jgi:hypothetical protein
MASPLRLLARIGPEIVAAASDNDPTNVGTATAVGAGTAYQLSWVAQELRPLAGSLATDLFAIGAHHLGRGCTAYVVGICRRRAVQLAPRPI